ncbi:RNA methyltransferase [Sphingobacteriaceae bacterium]|nr:RNA methyltransferase [Sphingobacteriaceae bacterium]
MAYAEHIADRIREALVDLPLVDEKKMFGGVCFMVDGKMCVGVIKDEMMCRIDPEIEEMALEQTGCRQMDFQTKHMKGYVYISDEGMRSKKKFDYWIDLCLDFNKRVQPSKKSAKKKKQG